MRTAAIATLSAALLCGVAQADDNPGAFWSVAAQPAAAAPAWTPPNGCDLWLGFNADQASPTDLSGSGVVTTRRAAPTWNASGYYTMTNNTRFTCTNILNSVTALTVSVWVNVSPATQYDFPWYAASGYWLDFDPAGTLNYGLRTDLGTVVYLTTSAFATGVWQNVVCTWCGTNGGDSKSRIYVNGVIKGTSGAINNAGKTATSTGTQFGGLDLSAAYSLDGSIDSVMVWQQELSSNQVNQLWSDGNAGLYGPNAPGGLEGSGL